MAPVDDRRRVTADSPVRLGEFRSVDIQASTDSQPNDRTEAVACSLRRNRRFNAVWDDARVVSGPKDAPPLVLLHWYMATSVMWSPNMIAFSRDYRVYAIDTMGQPGKSIPDEPIRNAADYVAWLTATLDGVHVDRVSLVGMSFGGWLALTYAAAAPERVDKLVLLSAGGVLPIARQFSVRGMLMVFFPTRFTVSWFMRWAGFTDAPGTTGLC